MLALGCLGLVLFLDYVKGSLSLRKLKFVLAIAGSNIILEFFRSFVLGLYGVAIRNAASVARAGLSLAFGLAILNHFTNIIIFLMM